jgi:hypothetical protein
MAPDSEPAATLGLPKTGVQITVLDPAVGYLTVINTYAVAPERAEALLNLLVRATTETLRQVPGFVSARL